ncbi:MAG: hypothetical protein LBH92_04075 [Bacteroidales bacterium]|jgi:hypothetical protein|nr:hypothetical protein [Bacteroidales bacterium]
MIIGDRLLTVKEASEWATDFVGRDVTTSNISYLIQYGRIKQIGDNGSIQVSEQNLLNYYKSYNQSRETAFREKLGDDLNWVLSFEQYKESEATKHVRRLHPYKGKFIPQLVEYFLDNHTDKFKTENDIYSILKQLNRIKADLKNSKEHYLNGQLACLLKMQESQLMH